MRSICVVLRPGSSSVLPAGKNPLPSHPKGPPIHLSFVLPGGPPSASLGRTNSGAAPAALGAAPTAPSGRAPGAPPRAKPPPPLRISVPEGARSARPPASGASSLGEVAKRRSLPPRIPVSSAAPPSRPPSAAATRPSLRKAPKSSFSAGGYVAGRIARHFATAGQVAGAIFNDALEQRGLPTPLGPQVVPLPDTVVATVPEKPRPQPIIPLDPGIEEDNYSLFRDDGPLGPVVEGLCPFMESDMEF